MARNKLNPEQRQALLVWLAADYDSGLIRKWFQEQGWPSITKQAVEHYRKRWTPAIEAARAERHSKALTTGLALKDERVQRLKLHADELDAIKWLSDEKGRLWNEKAWRETLEDIAAEMGHRKKAVELTGADGGPIEIDDARERLASRLAGIATRSGAAGAADGPDGTGSGSTAL